MSCFTRRRATPKQSTRACSGGGAIPRLSPKEYDILRLLVLHASKVLTHRMIMREVWGGAGDVHYLRVYVRQLRQKLEADPDRPRHILTETGSAIVCALQTELRPCGPGGNVLTLKVVLDEHRPMR